MRADIGAILLDIEKGVKFLFILFGKCNKGAGFALPVALGSFCSAHRGRTPVRSGGESPIAKLPRLGDHGRVTIALAIRWPR